MNICLPFLIFVCYPLPTCPPPPGGQLQVGEARVLSMEVWGSTATLARLVCGLTLTHWPDKILASHNHTCQIKVRSYSGQI